MSSSSKRPPVIAVNVISDDETTPFQKKQKTSASIHFDSNPSTVLIIDDDPTPPCKSSTWSKSPFISCCSGRSVVPETPSVTPSVVPETPIPESSYVPILRKCNNPNPNPNHNPNRNSNPNPSGLICLESDEEGENESFFENDPKPLNLEVKNNFEVPSICLEEASLSPLEDNSCFLPIVEDDLPLSQISDHSGEDVDILPLTSKNVTTKDNKKSKDIVVKKRSTAEERARLMNERKQQKEKEKIQKMALKAQAAEAKKMQKEIERWEKGKFAQQSIVAKIDTKVVEQGSIGGQLLTRLAEKGITFQITSNPIERSIIWTMSVPQNIAQAMSRGTEIPYVLLVFEAKEFCDIVSDGSIMDHVARVQSIYPSHTLCFLTNRLLAYITKRDQENYKNPGNDNGWRRPQVEKALSKLTTHFVGVHSRLCTDESELAEHVVGLTCSLSSCQFRKKLNRLSVNANGSLIPKDATDRALIKKTTWLKALLAIPKVQPRFAVAIWRKYPTIKSLLRVYMDPHKSEHEKEVLLANLITEGLVGDNKRLGEVCSKRVYRILLAESGTTKTDDVENGADFFTRQSSL